MDFADNFRRIHTASSDLAAYCKQRGGAIENRRRTCGLLARELLVLLDFLEFTKPHEREASRDFLQACSYLGQTLALRYDQDYFRTKAPPPEVIGAGWLQYGQLHTAASMLPAPAAVCENAYSFGKAMGPVAKRMLSELVVALPAQAGSCAHLYEPEGPPRTPARMVIEDGAPVAPGSATYPRPRNVINLKMARQTIKREFTRPS